MKIPIHMIAAALLVIPVSAEYRIWTSSEGKEAKLELYQVIEADGEKVGKFRMTNGRSVSLKASELSKSDRRKLLGWVPGGSSVFDEVLWGNLLTLQHGKLRESGAIEKPRKYYIFYYTASWCGPCQKFTPSLVKWYNENKNGNFEIFLISADRGKEAMESYAKSKKMPWPHLKMGQLPAFRNEFQHGVRGIPALIVCERDGTVIGDYRSQLIELTDMVKG